MRRFWLLSIVLGTLGYVAVTEQLMAWYYRAQFFDIRFLLAFAILGAAALSLDIFLYVKRGKKS
jgi:hypothetical protein